MTELPSPTPIERTVFITHHAPDMENLSVEQFTRISGELKKMGFSEHRFDVRWKSWAPDQQKRNDAYIQRSANLAKAAYSQGLDPLVILSTPPGWTYRNKSSAQIQTVFQEYAREVKRQFDIAGVPIPTIQILNELNNPVYTPSRFLKELPTLTQSVKEIFGAQTDVTATMVIAEPWANIEPFMEKHQRELSALTSIGLDFYPGSYQFNKNMLKPKSGQIVSHQVLEAIATKGMKNIRPDFLALLQDQMTDVHEFTKAIERAKNLFPDKQIDLGEFGFPTLEPIQKRNPRHQILQRQAIQKITDALVPVLDANHIRKIGFYELFDDKEFGVLNWGIINDRGEAKHIAYHLPTIITKLKGLPLN